MIQIILTTLGLAALSLGTYWLLHDLLPRLAAQREANRELVRRDPLDYTRAYLARVAPARLALEQSVADREATLDTAEARSARLLISMPKGSEPSDLTVVVTVAMCVVWLVTIVAAARIDLPIVLAVSGGNRTAGILGTLLVLGVPVASSLALGELIRHRKDGMHHLAFAVAAAGLLSGFVIVVALLTQLAPIRAAVEYEDPIRMVNQEITQFSEDHDATALAYARQHLTDLQAQQVRSATFNQALVPMAAVLEFGTGLYLPVAIPTLMLLGARSSKAKARAGVRKARSKVDRSRAHEVQELSREFQRAGVSQAALQAAIVAMAPENMPAPLQIEGPTEPAPVSDDLPRDELTAPATPNGAPSSAPAPPVDRVDHVEPPAPGAPAPAPQNPLRAEATLDRNNVPDDSFDLS